MVTLNLNQNTRPNIHSQSLGRNKPKFAGRGGSEAVSISAGTTTALPTLTVSGATDTVVSGSATVANGLGRILNAFIAPFRKQQQAPVINIQLTPADFAADNPFTHLVAAQIRRPEQAHTHHGRNRN